MDTEVDELLRKVGEDRESGASSFVRITLEVLRVASLKSHANSIQELMDELWDLAITLARARPTFSTIPNSVAYFLEEITRGANQANSIEQFKRQIISSSLEIDREHLQARERVIQSSSALISHSKTILTHSYSINVKEALLKYGRERNILCTESRPLFEGKTLANAISKSGIKCTLITEASVSSYIKDVDLVLVGADAIYEDGSVVNKVGTRMIGIMAKDEGKPFFVISETWKMLRGRLVELFSPEEGDESEILGLESQAGLKARNPYYDTTEPNLISGIVTEFGVLAPSEVKRHSKVFTNSIVERLLNYGRK